MSNRLNRDEAGSFVGSYLGSNCWQRLSAQGGTLIFSYICGLAPFFGFQILNLNIFLGFQKKSIFFYILGMKILLIIFFFLGGGGVIIKLDYFWGSFPIIF